MISWCTGGVEGKMVDSQLALQTANPALKGGMACFPTQEGFLFGSRTREAETASSYAAAMWDLKNKLFNLRLESAIVYHWVHVGKCHLLALKYLSVYVLNLKSGSIGRLLIVHLKSFVNGLLFVNNKLLMVYSIIISEHFHCPLLSEGHVQYFNQEILSQSS